MNVPSNKLCGNILPMHRQTFQGQIKQNTGLITILENLPGVVCKRKLVNYHREHTNQAREIVYIIEK